MKPWSTNGIALAMGMLLGVLSTAEAETGFQERYGAWTAECNNVEQRMGCGLYSIVKEQEPLSTSRLTYTLFVYTTSQPVIAQLIGDQRTDWQNTKIFYHLDITFRPNPHSTTPIIPDTHQAELGCKYISGNSCTLNMLAANDMILYVEGGKVQFTLTHSNTPRIYEFYLNGFAQALKAVQGAMQRYLPAQ